MIIMSNLLQPFSTAGVGVNQLGFGVSTGGLLREAFGVRRLAALWFAVSAHPGTLILALPIGI
jgi:hypothetical protein